AQGEKLVVARHEQADPMSERAHLRELVGNGARSLDANGIGVVERARVFNDDTSPLEQFASYLARLRLRLGGLCLLQALAPSLDRSVDARKLTAVSRNRGVYLVEPLPRLDVAGVRIERDGSTLVGKFGAALDASSMFCFKIGDYGFRFLNLIH